MSDAFGGGGLGSSHFGSFHISPETISALTELTKAGVQIASSASASKQPAASAPAYAPPAPVYAPPVPSGGASSGATPSWVGPLVGFGALAAVGGVLLIAFMPRKSAGSVEKRANRRANRHRKNGYKRRVNRFSKHGRRR